MSVAALQRGAQSQVRNFGAAAVAAGFDIVHPFATNWYNEAIRGVTVGTGTRKFELATLPPQKIGLLVGNSKNLWKPFLDYCSSSSSNHHLSEAQHPLDSYTYSTISELASIHLGENGVSLFFSHEVSPSRLLALQRLAHVSGLSHYDPEIGLCIHPEYGVWHAFRAVIVLTPDVPSSSPPCAVTFPCDERIREEAKSYVNGISRKETYDWQDWLVLRDMIQVGKSEWRYSENQILYHYTKRRDFLCA